MIHTTVVKIPAAGLRLARGTAARHAALQVRPAVHTLPITAAPACRLSAGSTAEVEVLAANRALLDAISAMDWGAYSTLCDENISCFEPEATSQQVVGQPFHKYYFDLAALGLKDMPGVKPALPPVSTMCSPIVKVSAGGSMAVVSYVRAVQSSDPDGNPKTAAMQETRVWEREPGKAWKNVHLHKSGLAESWP